MTRLDTLVVHAHARHIEGAVVTPVFQSANFLHDDAPSYDAVRYARLSNSPQHLLLHKRLATLEAAEEATTFSSGMAAISSIFMSQLRQGDHVVHTANLYGGTATLLADLEAMGVTATAVDGTDPGRWAAAVRPTTRMFYTEAVSNPCMEVPDLPAVVAFARARGLVSVIDNTFLSPVQLRPIALGFDLVLHSATKYLNGHSDVTAGVVAGSAAHLAAISRTRNHLGGNLDPHAAFLLERGLKTLVLRVRRQADNALALAQTLATHPRVARVRYPGLPADPHHRRAAPFDGFGGMFAFDAQDSATADAFLDRVQVALHAASLGGVETLVVRPSRTSHLGMSEEQRQRLGITDSLIRVSAGVEHADDLIADFTQALG